MNRELPTAARLAAFGAVLAVGFGAAYAVGVAAAPVEPAPAAHGEDSAAHTEEPAEQPELASTAPAAAGAAPVEALPGLAVSRDGFTLEPEATTLPTGTAVPVAFRVTTPDGSALTAYETSHERDLHLVAVRRDLTGFQHVHPELGADGVWRTELDLAEAGAYRLIADFTPAGGEAVTLGTDLLVPGPFAPEALPAPAATAEVDGYEVVLTGTPQAGGVSTLQFTVSRDGDPVTDLEPHLGAFGHLVALRVGDLAYLHTHPAEDAEAGQAGGPTVAFATELPTAGTYRFHLEFRVDGEVHTAPFTVVVPRSGEAGAAPAVPDAHDSAPHGH